MELALSQVVLLGMIPQPGQLQAEIRLAVAQIDNGKPAVGRILPAHRLQIQGILVEFQGLVQIRHIEVKMIECQHCTHLTAEYNTAFRPRQGAFAAGIPHLLLTFTICQKKSVHFFGSFPFDDSVRPWYTLKN